MRKARVFILIAGLLAVFSCAKVDRNKPFIASLKINGDAGDTIYTGKLTLNISYEITDDVMIVDSRLKMVQQDDLDSGFFYLNITSVNARTYSGNATIIVPDSVTVDSKLFKLSIDAFDDSGNQADPIYKIINFK
jgi:hypothetical protein